jgi:hypothetical protein
MVNLNQLWNALMIESREKLGDGARQQLSNVYLSSQFRERLTLFPHIEDFHGEACVAVKSNTSKARGVAGEIRVGLAFIYIDID